MNKETAKSFIANVQEDKLLDARRQFLTSMKEKQTKIVLGLRQDVAKKFFDKSAK